MNNFKISIYSSHTFYPLKYDNSGKTLDKLHFATFLFYSHLFTKQQGNQKLKKFLTF